jgi:hypothetical protein
MQMIEVDGNRRIAPRVKRQVALRFRTPDGVEGRGTTVNLSATGVRVVFYSRPAPVLLLEIGPLRVQAKAVWAETLGARDCYVAGLHFEELDQAQRESLLELLSAN